MFQISELRDPDIDFDMCYIFLTTKLVAFLYASFVVFIYVAISLFLAPEHEPILFLGPFRFEACSQCCQNTNFSIIKVINVLYFLI